MIIAIPSYRRRKIIETQTLPMLKENGVDMSQVHVFVSDYQDAVEYDILKNQWGVKIVYDLDLPDIVQKFNYIHQYFEVGQQIIFIEDDIQNLSLKVGENKLEKFTRLPELASRMFEFSDTCQTKIWGISSNANPFYMKNQASYGFKFVVANMFGFVATKDQFLKVSQFCKSDYERTLLYFVKFGGICRMDGVCAITKNYKTAGGLQEMRDQRGLMEQNACQYLVRRFPHLVEVNEKKSKTSIYMELKLKTIRKDRAGTDWMGLQKHLDQEMLRCDLRSKDILNSN